MKKLVLATILVLATATAQAEYKIAIGLTESHHGGIPENGLVFKNKTTQPVTPPSQPPQPECAYNLTTTYWKTALGGNTIELRWNSETLGTSIGNISTYDYNGYTYTKGVKEIDIGPPYYEVCRLKI